MKFTFLTALICVSIVSSAQIHWAFKAGGQINTARYKTADTKFPTSSTAGFNAGVAAKIYFDDRVAFVSGIEYNAKGYRVVDSVGGPQKTFRLNYLDIPILLQIDLAKKRGEGLYCKIGPSIGIGLNGKQKYNDKDGVAVNRPVILSVTGNHFGAFNAAMNAGLGYSFKNKFFAETAFSYGIGNIYNDPDGPNIKTRVVSLSIGSFLR